jgi:threonine dehydrogenase-like Zn-dependent dehydrogenase
MKEIRAARWTAERELEIEVFPATGPGAGEVQVAVASVGVCGSDLHFFRGKFPPRTGLIPGHEFAGAVSAVGSGVDHLREGDVVGIEPLVYCGRCRYCQTGNYHECVSHDFIGESVDGGMTQLATVPGYTAVTVPRGVDAELAALAEPLACSVHGFEKARLSKGETVLVLGAGTVGLMALLAARAVGARSLIVARHPHQQETARRLGADEVIGDDEAGAARLAELAREEAIDVAIELVGGQADTIIQAQRVVRRLGRVLVLGVFTIPTANIDPLRLMGREIEIIGAVFYAAPNGRSEYKMALDILADHAEAARTVVTHRFALDQANEAYATALDKSSRSIKVHVNPNA